MIQIKEKDIKSSLEEILDEARTFAQGDGLHFYYGEEEGHNLKIPQTKIIIDNLIIKVRKLSKNIPKESIDIERQINNIYKLYNKNYMESGRTDGYLVKNDKIQIYGNQMCGG